MKTFIQYTLGAIGITICAFLFFIGVIYASIHWFGKDIISQFIPGTEYATPQSGNTLKVTLNGNRSFFTNTIGIDWIDEQIELKSPFYSKLAAIYKAAEDNEVKLLWLDCNGGISGNQFDEVIEAIQFFKASGKPVYASAEIMNYSSMSIASFADSIFVSPSGYLNIKGLSAKDNYYKSFLDQFGVQVEVFKQGKYKSAPSSYSADHLDEFDAAQTQQMLNDVHTQRIRLIAKNRKVLEDSVKVWIDQFQLRNPKEALKKQIIDGIQYEYEVERRIAEFLSTPIEYTSYGQFSFQEAITEILSIQHKIELGGEQEIAILPLHGEIIEGAYREGTISAQQMVSFLRKKKEEGLPDALIIHWNSPGGSARGSEQIRVVLAEIAEEIPVYSYFSNIGASGAVLAATPSNALYCSPNSLVGSIGVFALYPNFSGVLQQQGINREGVKTSDFADFGDPFSPMPEAHKAIIQSEVDTLYQQFLGLVGDCLGISKAEVDEFAQGRVWTGTSAFQKTPMIDLLTSFPGLLAQIIEKQEAEIEVWEMPKPLYSTNILSELGELNNKALDEFLIEEMRKLQGNYTKLQFAFSE